MRLQNQRAIVTGGASGIGRAIGLRFAREGATVVIADLNERAAERVAEEIADAGGLALAVRVDVADEASVGGMFQQVASAGGPGDILVNNATNQPHDGLLEMDPADWDRDLKVSLYGPYLCSRAALPDMIEAGGGAIVNIASVNALGFYGQEAYSAAKAGLISLTRSIAVRYGRNGVRANAVAAGTVRTPVWDSRLKLDPHLFARATAWYPAGRVGEPEDVANCALFLASTEAAWITGTVVTVDGGLTAGSFRMTTELIPDQEFGHA